ncbi:hypothetical protein [Aestuariibacter sp. GS-14]|uniref:hypothetical protein n=1 Tax=Aestuariibacter sp. GS-14 TaxID=2590670 RepID=UPI0015E86ADB|nr:hypothetical protein [Aestuariibacter sp. GS-14]
MIRWRTGSKWSHVAILDTDDAHVIEAKGGFGVLRSHLSEFEARYREIEYREIDGDIGRAVQLIGKPFDNVGIKGVFFRSFKHCPDSWFCSELVAYSTSFIPDEFAQYQTPETLYRLSRQCTKTLQLSAPVTTAVE